MNSASNDKLVIKSNHLVEASYRLSIQEQRVILLMASMIKPEDEDFQIYRIDIKYFLQLTGLKDKNSYAEVKDVTRKLRERTLFIKKPESELQIGWLSSAEYFDGKGYVELEFSPKLKPYLLKLKEFFTKYQLRHIIRLRGIYSVRIYELLKQYAGIGKRTLTLEELRTMLGIAADEYKLYGHFKSRVLKPAQAELAKKTDLRFDIQEEKKGRKTVAISFIIKENRPEESERMDNQPERLSPFETKSPELFQRLQASFCLSGAQATRILKNYDEEYITGNLSVIEEAYKAGQVKKLAAYTLKALKEDFRPKKSALDQQKAEKEEQRKRQRRNKDRLDRLQSEYDQAVRERGARLCNDLSEAEKEPLIKQFEEQNILPHRGMVSIYRERGLTRGIFRSQFENFLVSRDGAPELKNLIAFARSRGVLLEQNQKGEYQIIEGQG